MQVQDVLKVVGLSTLDSFPWGERVIDLVNSFLDEAHHLTPTSTGEDLIAAVAKMTEAQRAVVLQAHVSLRRGDLPAETQEIIEKGKAGRIRINPGILIVGVISLIAFILTISLSINSAKTGQPADTSGLVAILQILGELAGTIFTSGSAVP